MKNIFLSIAGFTIELVLHVTEYSQAQQLFLLQLSKVYGGFMIDRKDEKIDFSIHVMQSNQTEVLKYKERNYIEYYKVRKDKNSITTFYSVSIEQLAQLLRYILFHLIKESGFFMHGAAVIHNNKALLFVGASGAGKSTIVEMVRKISIPFADDSFVIRKIKGAYYCFQTPFLDKQTWIKKIHGGFPIAKIYLLTQSKTTFIQKVDDVKKAKDTLFVELISNQTNIKQSSQLALRFLNQFANIHSLHFSLNKKEVISTLSVDTT